MRCNKTVFKKPKLYFEQVWTQAFSFDWNLGFCVKFVGLFFHHLSGSKKNQFFSVLTPTFHFSKWSRYHSFPGSSCGHWKSMQHQFILLPFLYSFNFRDFCGSVGADVAPFLLLPTYPSLLCLPWPQNSGCKNAHPGFPREIKILLNPASSSSSSGETKAYPPRYLLVVWTRRKSREIFNTVPLLLLLRHARVENLHSWERSLKEE